MARRSAPEAVARRLGCRKRGALRSPLAGRRNRLLGRTRIRGKARAGLAGSGAARRAGPAASRVHPAAVFITRVSASTLLLSCKYAVKGIVDLLSLVLIYWRDQQRQDIFAVDLFRPHAAHGIRRRGRRVRKCLVLYIAAEAGVTLQRRVRAWPDHREIDPDTGAFWIRQRGISLMEDGAADQIEAELSTIPNPDNLPVVIVVDTLSRSLAGGDENRDIPSAIGVCDRLRDRVGATMVLVHHTGKDADKGPRGHSSLLAAVGIPRFASKTMKGFAPRPSIKPGMRFAAPALSLRYVRLS